MIYDKRVLDPATAFSCGHCAQSWICSWHLSLVQNRDPNDRCPAAEMASPRKASQFSGAAAMFQKKEKEMLEKQGSASIISPRPTMKKFGNASMGRIGYSPGADPSLKAPSFVSPGAKNYPTSSYLDKPSGVASRKSATKTGLDAFSGLVFSPLRLLRWA